MANKVRRSSPRTTGQGQSQSGLSASQPRIRRSTYRRMQRAEAEQNEAREVKRRVGKAQVLTERDMEIVRRIAQSQVIGLEQAQLIFWTKADGSLAARTTAQTRLSQLVGAGYLLTAYTNVRRPGEQVYALTRKGAALLSGLERERGSIGLPSQTEMRQQLDAQDVRIALERELVGRGAKLVDWKNERNLRSQQTQQIKSLVKNKRRKLTQAELDALPDIADAQAVVEETGGLTYELNIEIDGQYFGQMLSRKISDMHALAHKSGLPVVWATTGGVERVARLNREVAEAGASVMIRVIGITTY